MPTDAENNGHGGVRPNPGKHPTQAVRETAQEALKRVTLLENQLAAADSGPKVPKSLTVMRQRMAFHLWQAGIIQKRLTMPGAELQPGYRQDIAEMEHHLECADDSASKIAPYEFARLATVKNLARDDEFDQPLDDMPDDGLDSLARQLAAIAPGPAPANGPGATESDGLGNQGRPAPIAGSDQD